MMEGKRKSRLKVLLVLGGVMVAGLLLGLFVLDGWLLEEPKRYVVFWSVFMCYAFVVIAYAVYDMMRTFREIKNDRF